MDKNMQAHQLGVQMFADPWLTNEIKNAEAIFNTNGPQGLRLAAREITKDDHFMMNYWPRVVRLAGGEGTAKVLLRNVIDGYVEALIATLPTQAFPVAGR